MQTLSRRSFIAATAAGAIGLASWSWHSYQTDRSKSLRKLLGGSLRVEGIAESYQALHPAFTAEDGWRELARRIPASAHDEMLPALRAAISRDFEHNDTVMIDGWVLSHSEALICALLHPGCWLTE